jgi:hypothetical protein
MKLLHVRELKSNIEAVGNYLRTDGPFEGKKYNFDRVHNIREK